MKKAVFQLGKVVNVPAEEGDGAGAIAFQLVRYTIDFFGAEVEGTIDTKILADGTQVVHGGDGFFPHGQILNF